MRRLALLGVVVLAALVVPVAATSGPAHPCVRGAEVLFRAADGTQLAGHRFGRTPPGNRTTVVLAHMSDGDLCAWVPYARALARKGFSVFAFDFRGHGLSRGSPRYARLAMDVAAAVREVRRAGARRVVVVGASLGGIAALVAAPAIRPAVDGVVSVSAPARIARRIDARQSVPRIRVPTLYLVAEGDRNPPYDFAADARALYERTATRRKRLVVVPGTLHGTFLVAGSTAVRAELGGFLRDPFAVRP